VDTASCAGSIVSPHYDSLVAKLIVRARDRQEAIARMRRALDEFIIEGIKTSIPFHQLVLKDPDFIKGNFNTGFADRLNGKQS